MKLATITHASPLGAIVVAARDSALVHLDFEDCSDRMRLLLRRRFGDVELHEAPMAEVTKALDAYFAGELTALDRLEVDPGGTPFQNRVWLALREIPPGGTESYQQVARRTGSPRAVRAVGRTNGLNPIALALPCHRVVGKDGTLTGYAGGIERKEWLLRHEGALL